MVEVRSEFEPELVDAAIAASRPGPWRDDAGPGRGPRSPQALRRIDVLGVISSEVRAPLLGIRAVDRVVGAGEVSEAVAEQLQAHSRRLARRLALLAEDLILVSRVPSDPLPLRRERLDLREHLVACAALFPDVTVGLDVPEGVAVAADRLRFHQVVTNLLRHAQRRSTAITLSALAGDRTVVLRVPDLALQDCYELDVVRMLVEAHGGHCSHDPQRLVLSVSLPRAD